uniref:Cytochrome P450 monooxygenase macH n=1 Tax=Penicillium terrestre TaxID=374132 RepID=MACH_PENTR|nr:RecName: Full=Cytochrome P450 monooxygenase macH; AltName: Full=Macrophorins biosynthesis cluster protein H [Penicillium terrestre]AVK70101.1 MacH [Penicillium terrestre]QBC75447.1 MacH [Penicillium terrestre]
MALLSVLPVSLWLIAAGTFAVYHAIRAVYLIFFSPLAVFPGSPWAALGEYWEAYWNIGVKPGRKGQMLFKLEEMHKRLGPALRMGPNEVHIYDPAFYHELYRPGSRYYKDPSMHKVLGAPSSTLAESDPVRHKQRKAPLEPLFSKKNILSLEPMLMEHVDRCSQRFDELFAQGKPVSMEWALKSLAMDMVSQFAFGQSLNALADPEFKSLPVRVFQQYLPSLHVIKAFPFVRLLNSLPLWIAKRISHSVEMGHELEQFAARRIDEYMAAAAAGKTPTFPTLMERLLIPIPEKGYAVPDKQGLRDELLTVISAGDDTTGIANTVTLFNIFNNREVHDRLLAELKTVMPTPNSHVSYLQLEALPYLTAVIKEGLRYSSPAASRTPRLVPPGGVRLPDGRFIPAGTRVGMAIYHIHYNETLFESPRVFDPERWLQGPEVTAERAKFLVPFSRGSRSCLGINLAYMEMYMAIAYIVRRFDLDLVGTTEEDMKWDDMVVPQFHGEFMALTKRRED